MFAALVAAWVLGLDQLTKAWVRESIRLYEARPVWEGFFQVTYVKNTGAAWGMFSGRNWALVALAAAMLAALAAFRRKLFPRGPLGGLTMGLLSGGIAGNLLDRLRLGFVTDYLDFHVGGWHWPAFNVADSAIFLGVCCYVACAWIEERREKKASAAHAAAGSAAGNESGSAG